jgi:hypothetical protein
MLKRLYRKWLQFSTVFGHIMSRIILGIMFFLIISPTGLLLRLLGKDPLEKGFAPELASYRVNSTRRPADHYRRPY